MGKKLLLSCMLLLAGATTVQAVDTGKIKDEWNSPGIGIEESDRRDSEAKSINEKDESKKDKDEKEDGDELEEINGQIGVAGDRLAVLERMIQEREAELDRLYEGYDEALEDYFDLIQSQLTKYKERMGDYFGQREVITREMLVSILGEIQEEINEVGKWMEEGTDPDEAVEEDFDFEEDESDKNDFDTDELDTDELDTDEFDKDESDKDEFDKDESDKDDFDTDESDKDESIKKYFAKDESTKEYVVKDESTKEDFEVRRKEIIEKVRKNKKLSREDKEKLIRRARITNSEDALDRIERSLHSR